MWPETARLLLYTNTVATIEGVLEAKRLICIIQWKSDQGIQAERR